MDVLMLMTTWEGYGKDRGRHDLRDVLVAHYLPIARRVLKAASVNRARLDLDSVESVANVAVWEGVEKYDPHRGNAEAFISRVVAVRIHSEIRRQIRERKERLVDWSQLHSFPARGVAGGVEVDLSAFESMMDGLAKLEKRVLRRLFVNGAPQEEIAVELGCTQPRVSQILAGAKKALMARSCSFELIYRKKTSPARAA